MYNTYAVTNPNQALSTVRSVNYGTVQTSNSFFAPKETPRDVSIVEDSIKSDFGKIKGVEILYFRNAQLERSVGNQNAFAAVGPLQVLYFPQYDRFVLSLNSWKYPLLKRIPIVGSSASQGIPVTYTLPTVNGFFTLIITRVENLDSLANLETILSEGSSFKLSDSDEISSHNMLGSQTYQSQYVQGSNLPLHGNMMQHGSYSPRYGDQYAQGQLGQSFHNTFQTGTINQSGMVNQSGNINGSTLTASGKRKGTSRWSRLFKKPEYGRDKGDRVGTSRHNLNQIQKRDINSMKMTNEVMAAVTYYPRKEVERWIVYNKEMANLMGFSPELADQDLTPFGHSILNRSTENTDPSLPCNQPITCEKPIESLTYQVGQNFSSATRHDGKVKHGYIQGHSHSIHPDVSGRFNNLSTSNFQPERFKEMTNTSGLYEASGISPISKIEQPYNFQEDNILSEEPKPTVSERIKEGITGNQHNAGLYTETNVQPTDQVHVSFSDKVKNMIHPSHKTDTVTSHAGQDYYQGQAISGQSIGQTISGQTISSQPISGQTISSQTIGGQTIGQTLIHPTTISSQTISSQPISGQTIRTLESSLPTHTITSETLQPSTQYLSGRTVTSTLPTLQERIRTVGTSLEQPTLGQRVKNVVSGTEQDFAQHHYAA